MGHSHKYHHSTSSEAVKSAPGTLHEVHLAAGSGAAGTATVYDNTAASGTIICRLAAVTGGGDRYAPEGGVPFGVGIFVALTGSGATADLAYD